MTGLPSNVSVSTQKGVNTAAQALTTLGGDSNIYSGHEEHWNREVFRPPIRDGGTA